MSGSEPSATADEQARRVDVSCERTPNFIGVWRMENPLLCDDIVEFFERNPSLHEVGSAYGGVDAAKKNSTDLIVNPKSLRDPAYAVFGVYFLELHRFFLDYLEQWPFLKPRLKEVDIGSFNIQRYGVGGHFAAMHTERDSISSMHRALVWMTYLNDLEEGGSTAFLHYGLELKPERGKTVIWPTDWTHAHRGSVVTRGTKYIITGWMHYPLLRENAGLQTHELVAERQRTA